MSHKLEFEFPTEQARDTFEDWWGLGGKDDYEGTVLLWRQAENSIEERVPDLLPQRVSPPQPTMAKNGQRSVTILRGMSGCGKTTQARALLDEASRTRGFSTAHISNDLFFETYAVNFSYERLKEAIIWAQCMFVEALHRGIEFIVVDNTHTRGWEYAFYVRMAKLFGYEVTITNLNPPTYKAATEIALNASAPVYKAIEQWHRFEDHSPTLGSFLTRTGEEAVERMNERPVLKGGEYCLSVSLQWSVSCSAWLWLSTEWLRFVNRGEVTSRVRLSPSSGWFCWSWACVCWFTPAGVSSPCFSEGQAHEQ